MSRSGTPNASKPEADLRIPFPFTDTPTACQIQPALFSHDKTSTPTAAKDIAQAKAACSGCPIVRDCLKWALAHPELTPIGVWGATTSRRRAELRRRLTARLGPDWVGVVAQREQAALQRNRLSAQRDTAAIEQPTRRRSRPSPPRDAAAIERASAHARLELELIPTRLAPYEPWREPLTPKRRASNLRHLELALAQQSPRRPAPTSPSTPQEGPTP